MAARITAGPEFALVGPPETLFRGNYDFTSGDNWDVMPDGRFVMVRSHADFGREVRILTDVVAPAQRGDDG